MKKSLTTTVAAVVALGASAVAVAAGPLMDRIEAGQPIRIGFANELPFAYPGPNGEPLGFVNAHTAVGAGFSTSWPTTWPIPPFVRLDHALTAGGLVATDVEDFDVAGSDHLGMIVTVAPTRPATP